MAESKAALVRQLKERGLPVPKGAKVAELQHRLKHWKSPNGYLMRLALPVSRRVRWRNCSRPSRCTGSPIVSSLTHWPRLK